MLKIGCPDRHALRFIGSLLQRSTSFSVRGSFLYPELAVDRSLASFRPATPPLADRRRRFLRYILIQVNVMTIADVPSYRAERNWDAQPHRVTNPSGKYVAL